MADAVNEAGLVKGLLAQELLQIGGDLPVVVPILHMRTTLMLAPPCLGPFKEPRAAAMAEYVSVPEEVTTWVVKVELLPPP